MNPNAAKEIKTMKLYTDVDRVYNELKELGYSRTDPLKVEDVCKVDEWHYKGTAAVDDAIKILRINKEHTVLDFGSGLGGPARHLAANTGCHVVALELQEDMHESAIDLTKRCGLSDKVKLQCGDILKLEHSESYDFLVSWLVILHIEDRKTLFKKCLDLLKPGGKIYIEDYYKLADISPSIAEDLKEAVYVSYLPTKEEYIKQMADEGFTNIQFDDLTGTWRPHVKERYQNALANRERNVRVLGEVSFEEILYFFSKISGVFESGSVGGCRIVASKAQ
ncbi:predicted protein [Nematostella vectensis]|uniref:phosphoethanolamine N-methyltransferase n=1 Tax=Nematostella vectensis TaxID=45351 RepID=A7SJF3_NEMVE|nr:phosphomethylethanolamine N-methyltransferase [Nematostella vectensis]EDO36151.1 predicted protein [Nematostella vectensis]|eukprot:XP_001628214.1 predicted protein [Nematostella vectensis]